MAQTHNIRELIAIIVGLYERTDILPPQGRAQSWKWRPYWQFKSHHLKKYKRR